ncbi:MULTISPECIES: M23 family metallopeptidase [unclassified Paenibacillus]|uniref:M23 family metallopeptidase n=1 Tax=unclassified Paenibacillus TaxID=185978 RepID=UPI0024066397|nr:MULTISPECIES: M23 family metallopeptidase [unclassified Paenibacillus]MDF9844001.1 stage IV sporulation protein FA [Paenibacillus sp. PastF-2]MDF9850606.1 stage IV sporulation protein FA [Paenibacillus sp. PastM-2]MDF9857244.1 stage IV sporulation protein FA [Paenibacillus sp. PastF-1]MDH6482456.1 stage IV sporulation protein FA [Paenibacillus sp. PastH-2]MDH6509941.1 stage IV sporulation protein FA [Paenibacillus sp. PastM-3]
MEQGSGIKGRRKERIRSLLDDQREGAPLPLYTLEEDAPSFKEWGKHQGGREPGYEPDPEVLWKQNRGGWMDEGGDGGRPRFTAGLIRRTVASVLVFGAVWGIFLAREPWAVKAQAFITDALSNDMDFAAVQVWYETHFNGAPSFIPIFGEDEVPAEKVSTAHTLSAPLTGSILRSFADTLYGVEIMPESDSSGNVTVKSVDTGRVLSVSKEAQGGIRIVIRHTGGLTAEYGHLSGTRLSADDWVESGDTVGWMQETESGAPLLFFAVMKDKTYIDPAEVVSFD